MAQFSLTCPLAQCAVPGQLEVHLGLLFGQNEVVGVFNHTAQYWGLTHPYQCDSHFGSEMNKNIPFIVWLGRITEGKDSTCPNSNKANATDSFGLMELRV